MIPDFRKSIATPDSLRNWLNRVGIRDLDRGFANLKSIAMLGWSDQDLYCLATSLARSLPLVADPDRALNNLERLLVSQPLVAAKVRRLITLVKPFNGLMTMLSDSQYLADQLRDGDNFDVVALGRNQPVARKLLVDSAVDAVSTAKDQAEAMRVLRKFKHRETLRIAWGDLVLQHRVEQVTGQISLVAAAVCEAALFWCRRRIAEKLGVPTQRQSLANRFVILALGKLGGSELNYSSDIDLIAVYEFEGKLEGKAVSSNQEYFAQLSRDFIRIVGEPTDLGQAYRVDMRLRPSGTRGPICRSMASTIQYYDLQGRTWERQAMIKARPLAGDLKLGAELLDQLQPWIFRPGISRTDIEGIKSLKRQIERRSQQQGEDRKDVKTGYGGIRDVEFVIQFMQLLNGWNLASLRTANTLRAIGRLERSRCLMDLEARLLVGNYEWLRKLEHRLQLMHNQQTHRLPEDKHALVAVAKRMGINKESDDATLNSFREKLNEVTSVNRRILNHLMHGAFGTRKVFAESGETVSAEVDLILDSHTSVEAAEKVLQPYGFKHPQAAFQILMDLAEEKSRFVSSKRCKHFFASIIDSLLEAISKTPDPDRTLVSLSSVSDSLGARGVLWELFSESRPTLEFYVRLCSSSDYLATILKTNPGMDDELMDALQLESLPSHKRLELSLMEQSHGAKEFDLILSSFRNTQHMRIGIRDILGLDTIAETHRALSDVAEICLQKVTLEQVVRLAQKNGFKLEETGIESIPFVILGLGKLGGREPNYHSDLDLIFLFDSCAEFERCLPEGVSAQFFFSELAALITKAIASQDSRSRLYEIDCRLRPSGKSGALAVHVDEFERYFTVGSGQLWERQALCKARPVAGSRTTFAKVMSIVREVLHQPCPANLREEIWKMRLAMERDTQPGNLKRGPGGTVDIEFTVQMLQLSHCHAHPSILVPGTLEAIEELRSVDVLNTEDAEFLQCQYEFLRSVESGLRLMNTTARHDLPSDPAKLERLAYLLRHDSGATLSHTVQSVRSQVRQRVVELFQLESVDQ